ASRKCPLWLLLRNVHPMALDYRTIKLTYGEALVLYDFLDGTQEADAGIHTDDPVVQLAFWRLLGAIEREVIAAMDGGPAEYDRVLADTRKELSEAVGD